MGPITVYMADCQGDCSQYDATGKRFFKIYESGYRMSAEDPYIRSGINWEQGGFARDGYTITIPKNLKPGNYLVRHEMLNLEISPPQFYPECVQVTVTGNGDKVPSEEYLVSFPGAFSDAGTCKHCQSPALASRSSHLMTGNRPWHCVCRQGIHV